MYLLENKKSKKRWMSTFLPTAGPQIFSNGVEHRVISSELIESDYEDISLEQLEATAINASGTLSVNLPYADLATYDPAEDIHAISDMMETLRRRMVMPIYIMSLDDFKLLRKERNGTPCDFDESGTPTAVVEDGYSDATLDDPVGIITNFVFSINPNYTINEESQYAIIEIAINANILVHMSELDPTARNLITSGASTMFGIIDGTSIVPYLLMDPSFTPAPEAVL